MHHDHGGGTANEMTEVILILSLRMVMIMMIIMVVITFHSDRKNDEKG